MNKQRRKEINQAKIRVLSVIGLDDVDVAKNIVEDVIDDIGALYDEEYDYMENIPENMQEGEKYQKAEEACNNLEYAIDSLAAIDYEDKNNIEQQIADAIDFLTDATA